MSEVLKMHAMARALLEEAAKSDIAPPSPEAFEEAALGCAVVALLSASEARLPSADKLAGMLGAVVIIARHERATRKRTQQLIVEKFNRMWNAEDFVDAARRGAH